MIIHFICRGNAFRSIIAEAYLNSLGHTGLTALSSGTVAASHKTANLAHYEKTLELLESRGIREFAKPGYGDQLSPERLASTDIAICMNRRVYDDAVTLVSLPGRRGDLVGGRRRGTGADFLDQLGARPIPA